MAVSTSRIKRRLSVNMALVTLSIITALLAGIPLLAGFLNEVFGGEPGQSTAFAAAPDGNYAVYANSQMTYDEIFVAPVDDPSSAIRIARIDHLPGFISRGAVSPDGSRLALVTVDAGSPNQPGASLLVLNLESGELLRVALDVDHLQTPVWSPNSDSVIVTRGGDNAPGRVTVIAASANASGETVHAHYDDVLGAYPVGLNPGGELVTVLVDTQGSHVALDRDHHATISPHITRDWRLSPDGASLAFIESNLNDGVRYLPRSFSLNGSATVRAQSLAGGAQALGVAWTRGQSSQPDFGYEPGASTSSSGPGRVLAQSLPTGFDIPLAYSADGSALAVQHWTGDSFSRPGDVSFEIVTGDGRVELPDATRFFGWSAR